MAWMIQCNKTDCKCTDWADNIVDLIQSHTDQDGWILSSCGSKGFINKNFQLQEEGQTWEPYLRAIVPLGDDKDTYQPFVFLVSYKPNGPSKNAWFSYYKDLRQSGGRLKLGYGPGGPPVLSFDDLLHLLSRLLHLRLVKLIDVKKVFSKDST